MRKMLLLLILILIIGCSGPATMTEDEMNANAELLAEENDMDPIEVREMAGQASKFMRLPQVGYSGCTETDSGKDADHGGSVSVTYIGKSGKQLKTYDDACIDNSTLKEYYCSGDRHAYAKISCEGICDKTMCAPAPKCGSVKDCDDGNPCTEDKCMDTGECANTNDDDLKCDDGNPCTTHDHCRSGLCFGGPIDKCDDGNPCTTDSCDPDSGCRHRHDVIGDGCFAEEGSECTSDADCADDDVCTVEHCSQGYCRATPLDCDDGNECTTDRCRPGLGCDSDPFIGQNCYISEGDECSSDADCYQGDTCTNPDSCVRGYCIMGSKKNCDDGDPCTQDSCHDVYGCQHDTVISSDCYAR